MEIINGQIQFEATDTARLPTLAQTALADTATREGVTVEEWLSNRINNEIGVTTANFKEAQVQELRGLAEAIIAAPPEIRAQVDEHIVAVEALLEFDGEAA